MNIKVAAFTVSEKPNNTIFDIFLFQNSGHSYGSIILPQKSPDSNCSLE